VVVLPVVVPPVDVLSVDVPPVDVVSVEVLPVEEPPVAVLPEEVLLLTVLLPPPPPPPPQAARESTRTERRMEVGRVRTESSIDARFCPSVGRELCAVVCECAMARRPIHSCTLPRLALTCDRIALPCKRRCLDP
jgi:hypothetical protein